MRKGHRITMITSGRQNTPEMTVAPGREYMEVDVEGIHVVPIAAAYNNPLRGTGMSGVHRMRDFIRFARLATKVGKRLPKPDVVFATHTPLTIGHAGMKLARHFSVPFVFEVRDLWPDGLINIGALTNPIVIWWMRRMERKFYGAARHIVALSPGMKEGIVRAGTVPEKVTVIPNASDLDLFRPDLDGTAARKRLGLGDRFAAIYFGAMGKANGLEYTIEAARILAARGRDDIAIVLHGDGGKRQELRNLAQEYGLKNVIFSDLVPDKSGVAEIVAGCNVCLTIYAAHKETAWSPNKMFDALAAARPVLVNVPGWLKDVIETNDCGRYVDYRRPEALADALIEMAASPDRCRQMGSNARSLAEREFAREVLADRLERVLSTATRCAQTSDLH